MSFSGNSDEYAQRAQTLSQHPDARDSATALAFGAKANGVTTRRVGNTGGTRSHASRTSCCPGELSSTSSAQPFIYICRHPNCREERRLDASPQRQRCLSGTRYGTTIASPTIGSQARSMQLPTTAARRPAHHTAMALWRDWGPLFWGGFDPSRSADIANLLLILLSSDHVHIYI